MQLVDTMSGDPSRESLPQLGQLIGFAVVLPAAVAGSCHLLFNSIPQHVELRPWLYPWMVFSAAVLSWCVSRYLSPPWLSWIVFAWCFLLLNIITLAACLDYRIEPGFGFVLVSAEISVLVLWAILGAAAWQWRLTGVLIAAPAVIAFAGSLPSGWRNQWHIMMTLVAAVIILLSAGLRAIGFILWRATSTTAITSEFGPAAPHQFGLKHLLVWATAVVPLLLVLRGVNFWLFSSLGNMEAAFGATLVAASVATVSLIAVWSVLGDGSCIVRLAAVLAMPLLIAIGLTRYSAYLKSKYGVWPNVPILDTIIEMREHWVTWLWLDAALLASLLLFLRADGYRLMRKA